MLDWDKPLSEQAPELQKLVADTPSMNITLHGPFTYKEVRGKAYGITPGGEWAGPYDSMDAAKAATASGKARVPKHFESNSGRDLYEALVEQYGQAEASFKLRDMGIPGIKYLDAGSRNAANTAGTRNFVVFDDKIPKILKRE
jgi:hypothetical protein